MGVCGRNGSEIGSQSITMRWTCQKRLPIWELHFCRMGNGGGYEHQLSWNDHDGPINEYILIHLLFWVDLYSLAGWILVTVYELCSDHSDNEWVRMDWTVTHIAAHQPLDRSVRSVDREWVALIITIMDWLGNGGEQRYQIVDCDEWFDKICKLSVQWFMIINEYRIQWNRKGN